MPEWLQRPPHTREELLALVDQYEDDGSVDEHIRFFRDPYRRGYAQDDGPELFRSSTRADFEYPSSDEVRRPGWREQELLQRLQVAMLGRLLNPERVDPDAIYAIYQELPEPRMMYLSARLRHRLLRVLGELERKDAKSMLRYFAVLADVKNNGIPLTAAEWNAAISFAARYVGVSTETELESALTVWREMEQRAGIPATDVTFNILFDVASKAGNFTLADMIYGEMEKRGHRPNRYHHVSLIHYFGLKLDAAGVRAAYRAFVEAGEIVDTVVLNCVIAGLLRAAEPDDAERVYNRMKASDPRAQRMPARNYTTDRAITRVFMMFKRIGKRDPSRLDELQSTAPLTPNLQTYRILLNYHGVQAGDLTRVSQYLDDMKHFRISVHASIFFALFKGFASHGGYPDSPWSERRLDGIWEAFVAALDRDAAGLRVHRWLAVWALRAFRRCAPQSRVLDTYDELKARWQLDYAEEAEMGSFLREILKD